MLEFLSQPALLGLSALHNHSSLWRDLSSGVCIVLLLLLLFLADGGEAEFGVIGIVGVYNS